MKKTTFARLSTLSVAAAACAAFGATGARAADDAVKIGFITDMSGLYADIDGQGGLEAIRMAVADFGGKVNGKPIQILYADHQNKADIAASRAREWFDRDGVEMLIGGTNSATGLSMNQVAGEKHKVYINIGAGADTMTNEQCTPYTVHYAYDTVALAKGTGSAVTKQGGKTWYFLTADYAFGKALEKATSDVVKANGGQVLGEVRHPLSASDFSSFLLQAQGSKAQILGLANAGGDTINSIKAAKEFGVTKTMKLAALLMFIDDVHSLGLDTTQGLVLTDSWYWNKNADTRKWAQRYFDKMKKMPSSLQAADYSATTNYLKAVQAVGTTDPDKVMAQLKKQKIDDFYATGYVRQDGSMIHDMYLMQVKTPAESKEPWDYYKIVATIPGEQAFTTKQESRCALWK
ncbi:ABC transporter substrate-binding protein [Paraburkholderia caballeronis]|uniref:Amino acid/amide ABC transporter substrate-binding protein, HAAT family n=1 Tax=Paraburkholderia caballeronis TaxID=416943 RepID=A0A1H7GZK8_9BURK|nr:ABC transporter substrate-binding protein [Paraburkholderia caballeronis]PXW29701.1 amino acid/amide ABC transporter substrate-binding protein (HAAT family) [Paraburkholderia caballeronis]PXX04960.1 amino acid/amide ABC transporter substrate-binding protein (HAAT family) [Paraburkholderia caballeronis]RAK06021.1 amino acid/amide ABC transporter substrate-binding protein (HAAT family) [Paraburkholderia caballeronis]SEB46616.1 amino acid/amide ABC transporter substrate-binding protein, HAAT fa